MCKNDMWREKFVHQQILWMPTQFAPIKYYLKS